MRLMKASFIVLAALLIGSVANAARFEFTTTTDYNGTDSLDYGDEVVVDVFLSTDDPDGSDAVGLNFFGLNVLFDDQELDYVPVLNCEVGCDGTPSYILYSPASGATPGFSLYPQQNPWAFWPIPPTGDNVADATEISQLNVNFAPSNITAQTDTPPPSSPDALQIAKLVFRVGSGGNGNADIWLSMTDGGGVIRQNGITLDKTDSSIVSVDITDAFPLSVLVDVPEPAIAGLSIAALATLLVVRARRSNGV